MENGQAGTVPPTQNGNLNADGKVDYKGDDDWQEVTIDVPWGIVKGKWWGPLNKQPILALHGWQDNCGTFDRLMPMLYADVPVLCIDLPGHGHSTAYPKGMQYFLFWDGILLIRRIVRKYNWTNISLMGHSLGGALTFMYASIYPNEVNLLINIDIAGPTVRSLEKSAEKTGWALDKFLDYETLSENKKPCYDYDEMIKLVLDAYAGSVDEPSVKVLMKRGMSPAPEHMGRNVYQFSRDIRLKVSGLAMFTREQVLVYAKRIRCKVLNIRGMPGMTFENPEVYEEVINTLKAEAKLVVYEKVPGTHHLHLVTPHRVAPIINKFILENSI